jgi:hypothetical protein
MVASYRRELYIVYNSKTWSSRTVWNNLDTRCTYVKLYSFSTQFIWVSQCQWRTIWNGVLTCVVPRDASNARRTVWRVSHSSRCPLAVSVVDVFYGWAQQFFLVLPLASWCLNHFALTRGTTAAPKKASLHKLQRTIRTRKKGSFSPEKHHIQRTLAADFSVSHGKYE